MKATKLKNAAQITANCGRNTRVETMVAIELAASCKPFRKSNSSATATRAARTRKALDASTAGLEVFEQDAVDPVRHILEPVHHALEVAVDLRPDHEAHGVGR